MWLIKVTLGCCFLFICNATCKNEKILGNIGYSSQLHHDARELAEMCFKSDTNPVIISADLVGNNMDPSGNSMIVIDHKFQKQITGFISAYPTYVLSFESIGLLKAAIEHFRGSTLWSIKSPFLIVDNESECLNHAGVLESMWKQDLLAVHYLCTYQDGSMIFTLNPFASYAPAVWIPVYKFGNNEKKLTLYGMRYLKDNDICRNVAFDKTQKLDGHEVMLAAFIDIENIPQKMLVSEIKKYLQNIEHPQLISVYHILSHANITRNTHFFPYSAKVLSTRNGFVRQLVDKTIDMTAKSFLLASTNYKYMDILTEYDEGAFSILTKKSNYLTSISQVACDYQFLFLTLVMLMLIGMIVIINNKFDISSGFLDVMSLSAGMGVLTPLDRLSMRIIYISGFLFVFTVMPDFQGQVSSILSKPLRRNVESLKDLYDNNYHVYYYGMLTNAMINEKLWVTDEDKRYLHPSNFSELDKCVIEALSNSTIACILDRSLQLEHTSKSDELHASRDVIFKMFFVNWVRKDWNLKDNIDRISFWATESGFSNKQFIQNTKYFSTKLRRAKRIEERSDFEFIDFDTLMLSYMIVLGLSLWGLVAFGFEMLFHKYKKRRRQTLIRRRYRMELRLQLRNISSIEQIVPSTSSGIEEY
uniref:Ionotropic receptor n=1 Tax=Glyptapanteles indiensis TaxID=92994 RepID=B7S8Y4_GLYIN|nr:hypothetical protein GIP_L2_0100 [Glyptapanteles indiensis]